MTKFHIDLMLTCWVFWTPSLSYSIRIESKSARTYKLTELNVITRKRKHKNCFLQLAVAFFVI